MEGVHIWGIVDSFRKLGHDVDVISPSNFQEKPTKQDEDAGKGKSSVSRKIFSFVSRTFPELFFELAEIAFNVLTFKKITSAKQHKKVPYDLIYERYAIFAFMGRVFSGRWNIPFILEINYTAKIPLVRKRNSLLLPFAVMCDKWNFSRASSLAVVSSYLKNHLISEYGISEKKIINIPNAADPDVFFSKIAPIKEINGVNLDGGIAGFVGGFYPWHGLDLLVKAFASVEREIPETKLLLIGDGPERPGIEQLVKTLALRDKVLLAGRISHHALPKYIAAFTVGIMPDSNEYGSPMKIFEYMALQKPVIVPDYDPLLDVVKDGCEGFVFRRKEMSSLADCMLKIFKDESLASDMGEMGKKSIIERHNWLNNAKMNLDFIKNKPLS